MRADWQADWRADGPDEEHYMVVGRAEVQKYGLWQAISTRGADRLEVSADTSI